VRGLIGHRRMRESSILAALSKAQNTIPQLVAQLYAGLPPQLKGAAGLSVYAHLEDLAGRGLVMTDGEPALDGIYRAR
jgi:Beta-lactamase associated winged helix domain